MCQGHVIFTSKLITSRLLELSKTFLPFELAVELLFSSVTDSKLFLTFVLSNATFLTQQMASNEWCSYHTSAISILRWELYYSYFCTFLKWLCSVWPEGRVSRAQGHPAPWLTARGVCRALDYSRHLRVSNCIICIMKRTLQISLTFLWEKSMHAQRNTVTFILMYRSP